MTVLNYWAIVPAAGSGRRFGGERPKQFCRLGDQLVAQHSLARLLAITSIKKIIVPCDLDAPAWREVSAASHPRVERVAGGVERVHSVVRGLQAIEGQADPNDWVLVHDIARPCITPSDILKLIEQLHDNAVGGILATPVSDTLKQMTSDNMVACTPDRSLFRAAQTPQMFRYGLLLQALQVMLADGQMPTDEASAIEYAGQPVSVVEGRRDNIKITHREDLVIAEAIMNCQEIEQCE